MKGPCASVSELMEKYFDREVTEGEKLLVEAHLRDCSSCRDTLRTMEEVSQLMKVPAMEYAREADYDRMWLNIKRGTRIKESPSWREAAWSWIDSLIPVRKKVWVPAMAVFIVLMVIAVPLLLKKSTFPSDQFGVVYAESTTNNVMVYEIEPAKVTVIWLLEGPEGESNSDTS